MANYSPPTTGHIPFSFTTGGYQSPFGQNIQFNFSNIQSAMSSLGAAVNVLQAGPESQTWQTETYTYLKYCDQYVVGYNAHGVQILRKCLYGGIRDIGAYINAQPYADLPAYIKSAIQSHKNLPAEIVGLPPTQEEDLGAIIGGHLPEDLAAYIRGFAFEDLAAYINGLKTQGLPAQINPVPPKDLPAYLKVWPQTDIPGFIHGWQEADLPATLQAIQFRDLPAIIGGHLPGNLRGIIKGWVREAYRDLAATLTGFGYNELPAIIRGTEFADLPAYLYGIPPRNLPARIHGWQAADLPAFINAQDYPYNLPAYINGIPGIRNLPAYIAAVQSTAVPEDLPATLQAYAYKDLNAVVASINAPDLGATITPVGMGVNLPAAIYPKMIRLTAVLSVVTMESRNLSAVISIPCFYSDFKDLSAFVRAVYKKDLTGVIRGIDPNPSYGDLGARIGYADTYTEYDRLKINLSVAAKGYRVEDKIKLLLSIMKQSTTLSAYIRAIPQSRDLSAAIQGLELTPYDFERVKHREKVYYLTRSIINDYENVDIRFWDYVPNYFYSGTADGVAKIDKYRHWVTAVSSYYSPATAARLQRKLHKVKLMYDLRKFDSVDEAIRFAIDYVTTYPESDISALINPTGRFAEMQAYLRPIYVTSTYTELGCSINGIGSYTYDVVIGFTDDGVGYLNF